MLQKTSNYSLICGIFITHVFPGVLTLTPAFRIIDSTSVFILMMPIVDSRFQPDTKTKPSGQITCVLVQIDLITLGDFVI